ncbi:hypothetical protein N7489_008317 [Penicillium chrysogenum]|uniref:uncharacterized protein n=1 Tax=Penicillium chrysogenum TaxID=5076 RepID=UPI002397ACC9|nr:uncharacterized protein N7489_008317 [Penicillium chrysogenum]KAJ5238226.1 hypothetical protein N7489_008317 [Penicillium chrysogenum]KAJ5278531.1 hypothetical protein N7524_004684 [Penicillium chrysogenum]KAJ6159428.1 hypothetical protein N7497_003965 [Penicillium chrysogenum]
MPKPSPSPFLPSPLLFPSPWHFILSFSFSLSCISFLESWNLPSPIPSKIGPRVL